jgi:putative hemolysin
VPSSLTSPDGAGPFLVAGASLLAGSLFAGADIALATLTSARTAALLDEAKGAKRKALERIRTDTDALRSRYLFGRILTAALAAVSFQVGFAAHDARRAPVYAIGATVFLSATLYDITTNLGRRWADQVAPAAVRWLFPLELLLLPLSYPLSLIGRAMGQQRLTTRDDQRLAESEVEHMVDEVERSGLVGREPASIIRNVLEMQEHTARDVMVRRDKVEALDLATPIPEARRFVLESGHSRYPVYKGHLDNIVGLLTAKDLFRGVEKAASIGELLRRNPNFVAESMPLSKLLREMRARREHLAVVVDEIGDVSGIVTLEDVLEEIVGDIRDEHDEAAIVDLGDGKWLADASLTFEDVESYLRVTLPDAIAEEGPIGKLLESSGGPALEARGLRLVARDTDGAGRVRRVEIEVLPMPPPPPSSGHGKGASERPPPGRTGRPPPPDRQSDPDAA